MFPREADVRGVLMRYPDVTDAEGHALRGWYRKAGTLDLVAALNDPALEPSLVRLRDDVPHGSSIAVTLLAIVMAAGLLMTALG